MTPNFCLLILSFSLSTPQPTWILIWRHWSLSPAPLDVLLKAVGRGSVSPKCCRAYVWMFSPEKWPTKSLLVPCLLATHVAQHRLDTYATFHPRTVCSPVSCSAMSIAPALMESQPLPLPVYLAECVKPCKEARLQHKWVRTLVFSKLQVIVFCIYTMSLRKSGDDEDKYSVGHKRRLLEVTPRWGLWTLW